MKPIPAGMYVVTLTDARDYGHVMRTTDFGEAEAELKKLSDANYDRARIWQVDSNGALQPAMGGKR